MPSNDWHRHAVNGLAQIVGRYIKMMKKFLPLHGILSMRSVAMGCPAQPW